MYSSDETRDPSPSGALPPYAAVLGLHRDPFPAAPDGLFFDYPALTQRLNLLEHLTGFSNLVLLVRGEKGAGKTSLLQRLLSRGDPGRRTCHVHAHPMMNGDLLLRQIAACFDLSGGSDALIRDLREHLLRLREGGQLAVLLVDDAHELAPQTLEQLLPLVEETGADGPLLHVVLFCEPQIAAVLEAPAIKALKDRITHTLDIPPLSEEQTALYVRFRLEAAGLRGDSPLRPSKLSQVHRSARGLPGEVNARVRALLDKSAAQPAKPRGRLLHRPLVWLGAGVLAAVVATVLLFQDRINALFQEPAPPEPGPVAFQSPPPSPPPRVEEPLPLPPPELPLEAQHPDPLRRLPPGMPSLPEGKLPRVEDAAPEAPPPVAPPEAVAEPSPEVPVPAKADVPPPVPPAHAEEPKAPASAAAMSAERAPEPPAPEPAQPAEAQPPKVAHPAAEPPALGIRREAWLLDQDPGGYVLQLLGARTEPVVRDYIARHKLQGKVAYFKTHHQGGDWFVVVYGLYPDRDTARTAKAELPPAVRQSGPWPRSLASVHADIAKTGP